MGQSPPRHSQGCSSPVTKSSLISNWQQTQPHSNIFYNKVTNQQVHRHQVLINNSNELESYAERMHQQSNYICHLLYFHRLKNQNDPNNKQTQGATQQNSNAHTQRSQDLLTTASLSQNLRTKSAVNSSSTSTPHTNNIAPKISPLITSNKQDINDDSRIYCFYTDRMLPIKQWNKEKLIHILEALKKLIKHYGLFKIRENCICENERREIKVWINENPISNFILETVEAEEDMIADLAALLVSKKQKIVKQILDIKEIDEAIDNLILYREPPPNKSTSTAAKLPNKEDSTVHQKPSRMAPCESIPTHNYSPSHPSSSSSSSEVNNYYNVFINTSTADSNSNHTAVTVNNSMENSKYHRSNQTTIMTNHNSGNSGIGGSSGAKGSQNEGTVGNIANKYQFHHNFHFNADGQKQQEKPPTASDKDRALFEQSKASQEQQSSKRSHFSKRKFLSNDSQMKPIHDLNTLTIIDKSDHNGMSSPQNNRSRFYLPNEQQQKHSSPNCRNPTNSHSNNNKSHFHITESTNSQQQQSKGSAAKSKFSTHQKFYSLNLEKEQPPQAAKNLLLQENTSIMIESSPQHPNLKTNAISKLKKLSSYDTKLYFESSKGDVEKEFNSVEQSTTKRHYHDYDSEGSFQGIKAEQNLKGFKNKAGGQQYYHEQKGNDDGYTENSCQSVASSNMRTVRMNNPITKAVKAYEQKNTKGEKVSPTVANSQQYPQNASKMTPHLMTQSDNTAYGGGDTNRNGANEQSSLEFKKSGGHSHGQHNPNNYDILNQEQSPLHFNQNHLPLQSPFRQQHQNRETLYSPLLKGHHSNRYGASKSQTKILKKVSCPVNNTTSMESFIKEFKPLNKPQNDKPQQEQESKALHRNIKSQVNAVGPNHQSNSQKVKYDAKFQWEPIQKINISNNQTSKMFSNSGQKDFKGAMSLHKGTPARNQQSKGKYKHQMTEKSFISNRDRKQPEPKPTQQITPTDDFEQSSSNNRNSSNLDSNGEFNVSRGQSEQQRLQQDFRNPYNQVGDDDPITESRHRSTAAHLCYLTHQNTATTDPTISVSNNNSRGGNFLKVPNNAVRGGQEPQQQQCRKRFPSMVSYKTQKQYHRERDREVSATDEQQKTCTEKEAHSQYQYPQQFNKSHHDTEDLLDVDDQQKNKTLLKKSNNSYFDRPTDYHVQQINSMTSSYFSQYHHQKTGSNTANSKFGAHNSSSGKNAGGWANDSNKDKYQGSRNAEAKDDCTKEAVRRPQQRQFTFNSPSRNTNDIHDAKNGNNSQTVVNEQENSQVNNSKQSVEKQTKRQAKTIHAERQLGELHRSDPGQKKPSSAYEGRDKNTMGHLLGKKAPSLKEGHTKAQYPYKNNISKFGIMSPLPEAQPAKRDKIPLENQRGSPSQLNELNIYSSLIQEKSNTQCSQSQGAKNKNPSAISSKDQQYVFKEYSRSENKKQQSNVKWEKQFAGQDDQDRFQTHQVNCENIKNSGVSKVLFKKSEEYNAETKNPSDFALKKADSNPEKGSPKIQLQNINPPQRFPLPSSPNIEYISSNHPNKTKIRKQVQSDYKNLFGDDAPLAPTPQVTEKKSAQGQKQKQRHGNSQNHYAINKSKQKRVDDSPDRLLESNSSRDLIIQEKVQKQKQRHAQLKSDFSKLFD